MCTGRPVSTVKHKAYYILFYYLMFHLFWRIFQFKRIVAWNLHQFKAWLLIIWSPLNQGWFLIVHDGIHSIVRKSCPKLLNNVWNRRKYSSKGFEYAQPGENMVLFCFYEWKHIERKQAKPFRNSTKKSISSCLLSEITLIYLRLVNESSSTTK